MLLDELSQKNDMVDTVDVLNDGIERLKEEHTYLKGRLKELYDSAITIGSGETPANWREALHRLSGKMKDFMRELEGHALWEGEVLYPMLAEYTGKDIGPIAVMEHEHELAKQNVSRFLEAIPPEGNSVGLEEAKEAASYLLQSYVILKDHFKKEEDLLFPVAEQMVTDIEQFFAR